MAHDSDSDGQQRADPVNRDGPGAALNVFQGKRLNELTLGDVEALLDDAGAEPLHWEAKGIRIEPGEVRKQVCGFANSHDGGYLILGTRVEGDAWVLDGVEFPNADPPAWISDVANGVQPYPEGLDTRTIQVDGLRHIAVVWVPPTPTPPCNAHGTVYERVSGRTISVREPLRLAQLFGRGDQAHDEARMGAAAALDRALAIGSSNWPTESLVTIAVGLKAVGYDGNVSDKLFTRGVLELLGEIVPGDMDHFACEHRQDAVLAWTITHPLLRMGDGEWFLRASRDGSVGVACRCVKLTQTSVPRLVNEVIRKAWEISTNVLANLAPVGSAYLDLSVSGGQFGAVEPELTPEAQRCRIARGPIGRVVDDELLPGIEREVRRYMRETVFEPDADAEQAG